MSYSWFSLFYITFYIIQLIFHTENAVIFDLFDNPDTETFPLPIQEAWKLTVISKTHIDQLILNFHVED